VRKIFTPMELAVIFGLANFQFDHLMDLVDIQSAWGYKTIKEDMFPAMREALDSLVAWGLVIRAYLDEADAIIGAP